MTEDASQEKKRAINVTSRVIVSGEISLRRHVADCRAADAHEGKRDKNANKESVSDTHRSLSKVSVALDTQTLLGF